MSHALALCAVLLAACSSPDDAPSGNVTVHAASLPAGTPPHFAYVELVEPDGSAHLANLDDMGNASGALAAGGSVALVGGSLAHFDVQMYTDVQPGAALVFGLVSSTPAPAKQIVLDGALPGATDTMIVGSPCVTGFLAEGAKVPLSPACTGTVDLVVIPAVHAGSATSAGPVFPESCSQEPGYQHLHVDATDGAHAALGATWLPFGTVAVDLVSASSVTPAFTLESAWGLRGAPGGSASRVEAQLPGVGPLVVRGSVTRTSHTEPAPESQTVVARMPAGATTLDLQAVLGPWVEITGDTWTAVTDDGATPVATAAVTTFSSSGGTIAIYAPPAVSGAFRLADLPPVLSALVTPPDVEDPISADATLVRIEGADPAIDPQRLANILTSGGDPGGTSYAITDPAGVSLRAGSP